MSAVSLDVSKEVERKEGQRSQSNTYTDVEANWKHFCGHFMGLELENNEWEKLLLLLLLHI